jgi:hypothetical protein
MALLRPAPSLWLFLAACGLGASAGGGSDHLPNGGTGPYTKLSDPTLSTLLDEPFVVSELSADLSEPTALDLGDDTFRLWYSRRARTPENAPTEIWTAALPTSLTTPPASTALALRADQPYEGDRVAAPTVVRDPSDDSRLVMFYEAGPTSVARAVSDDDGLTWAKQGVVLDDARLPSVITLDGAWLLYTTRPSAPGIFVARSSDGETFVREPLPVLAPTGAGVDATLVDSPSASARTTLAGQSRVWLFYVTRGFDEDGTLAGIAYAGSHDGLAFARGRTGEPVLVPASASDSGGSAIIGDTESLLFYASPRGAVTGIAVARTP